MEQITQLHRWCGSLLFEMAVGGYALARFARPADGGYEWQRWAVALLRSKRADRIQGPGSCHLFHFDSASGLRHELDAAGVGDVALVLEAKDQRHALSKSQVDEFDGRTRDYFIGATTQGWGMPLYRMIWSAGNIDPALRSYAVLRGIILVSPDRVPLPVLLGAAEKWDATDWFPDGFLSELVLLGERACRPLLPYLNAEIVWDFPFRAWPKQDLADLEYVHALASDRWLNWLDQADPLHLESHAEYCLGLVAPRSRGLVGATVLVN